MMPAQSRSGKAVFSLVLLLALVTAACTAPKSEPVASTTLTFACPNSDLTVYQDAAEAFHQANPSIEVHVIPLDEIVSFPLEDETDTLGPVRQLASQADAFIWSTDAVEGGPPGLVLDLTTFVEADGEPTEDDFLTDLWDHFQWQGRTWGLPVGVDPLVVLYDPTAFEAAGVKPPAPGWSWEELFSAAQQLTQREGEQVTRYGFADYGMDGMQSFVEAQDVQLVDDTVQPPVPALDDPRIVAAVETYADLALKHGAMPNPAEQAYGDSFGVVARGGAAMSVTLARFWAQSSRDSELGIAPLPGKSPVGLNGAFVSAGTAHPEAAWRWLRFLSREVAPPDQLPARRSLISTVPFAASAGEEALGTFRYAAEHALPPVHPAAVEELLRQAAEQIFEGEETDDALDEAQRQALSLGSAGEAESLPVPTPAPTREPAETITFVAFDRRVYGPLVEAFRETHPEIDVTVKTSVDFVQPDDPPSELIEASGADCFKAAFPASAPEIQASVLSLQPFVDADPGFPLDDFLPSALEQVRHNGDVWGIPASATIDVLWYNQELFDEAGMPYPAGDWSWNDVFLAADQLADGAGEDRQYGFLFWPYRSTFLVQGLGGPLADPDTTPPTFHFDDSSVIVAAQQLAALVEEKIAPTPREANVTHFAELIQDGRVAMWVSVARSAWENEHVRPVALPASGRCLGSSRSFTAYYIAADTPHPEACWAWLRFLSERASQPPVSLPPRRSLLTSDAFRERVEADAQAAYAEMLACEGPSNLVELEWEKPSLWSTVEGWLIPALEKVIWHDADAQAELSEAQRKAEAYLECLHQRDDPEDEASAQACFEQVEAQ